MAGASSEAKKKAGGRQGKNSAFAAEDLITISTKQTKITRPQTMKFRCEDDDEDEEEESKEHISKQKGGKKSVAAKDNSSDEDDYDDEDDEEEEG